MGAEQKLRISGVVEFRSLDLHILKALQSAHTAHNSCSPMKKWWIITMKAAVLEELPYLVVKT